MSTDRYVIKSLRTYNGVEATSVLSTPTDKETAQKILDALNERYHYPGNYYLQKWEKRGEGIMSTYTKRVEQYMSTETVIYEDGVEIFRQENYDGQWYDTESVEEITEEEAQEYL